ncbi:hypothetical protein MKEN_01091400 [Mycena kentingensis (nom. inval.)]|nr:hypothetical protein MKEN_01091400 [Mycena kentingensis (nom. inval.)]
MADAHRDSVRASVYNALFELGALDANSHLAAWFFDDPNAPTPSYVPPLVDNSTEVPVPTKPNKKASLLRRISLKLSPRRRSKGKSSSMLPIAPLPTPQIAGSETDEGYASASTSGASTPKLPKEHKLLQAASLPTIRERSSLQRSSSSPAETTPVERKKLRRRTKPAMPSVPTPLSALIALLGMDESLEEIGIDSLVTEVAQDPHNATTSTSRAPETRSYEAIAVAPASNEKTLRRSASSPELARQQRKLRRRTRAPMPLPLLGTAPPRIDTSLPIGFPGEELVDAALMSLLLRSPVEPPSDDKPAPGAAAPKEEIPALRRARSFPAAITSVARRATWRLRSKPAPEVPVPVPVLMPVVLPQPPQNVGPDPLPVPLPQGPQDERPSDPFPRVVFRTLSVTKRGLSLGRKRRRARSLDVEKPSDTGASGVEFSVPAPTVVVDEGAIEVLTSTVTPSESPLLFAFPAQSPSPLLWKTTNCLSDMASPSLRFESDGGLAYAIDSPRSSYSRHSVSRTLQSIIRYSTARSSMTPEHDWYDEEEAPGSASPRSSFSAQDYYAAPASPGPLEDHDSDERVIDRRGIAMPFPTYPVLSPPLSASRQEQSRIRKLRRYRRFSDQQVDAVPYRKFVETMRADWDDGITEASSIL